MNTESAVDLDGSTESRWVRLNDHLIDLVFAAIAVGGGWFYVVASSPFILSGDDWRYLEQGMSWSGLLAPYNQHLNVVALVTYQGVARLFGLQSYLPFRLVGIASALLLAAVLYVLVRKRVGPAFALVAGVAMIFYPDFLIAVSAFNHYAAFISIALVSWLLTRDRPRQDIAIFGLMLVAVCSSGVAIAGAAGCLAYVFLTWAPWRRWLAIIVPLIAWFIWSIQYPNTPTTSRHSRSSGTARYVWDGFQTSFRGLAFDNQVLGVLLSVLFFANLAWRLRSGIRAAAHELSWTIAAIAWWVGLSSSRSWLYSGVDVFRYRFISSGFLILAFLPRRRTRWVPSITTDRAMTVAALAISAALIGVNIGQIHEMAVNKARFTTSVGRTLAGINLGPTYVPDETKINVGFAFITAGEYRSITERFGVPDGTTPTSVDRLLFGDGIGKFQILPENTRLACAEPKQPIVIAHSPSDRSTTILKTGDRAVAVSLRLVGNEWIPIGTIPANTAATLRFPYTPIIKPWLISAPGVQECATGQ